MDSKTQTLPTPRLKQFPEGWGRWFDGGENGKIYGKGMKAARKISRRFGWTTGTWTRSASPDCIVRTVSFGPDPIQAGGCRRIDGLERRSALLCHGMAKQERWAFICTAATGYWAEEPTCALFRFAESWYCPTRLVR